MRNSPLAAAALFLLFVAVPASAQTRPCLHGATESRADRTRREKAVELAHEINGAQEALRRFRRPDRNGYAPLDQLRVSAAPDGFRVQLNTDGTTYSFSIKDMMDPCFYAVFSDQSGDVYEATPAPLTPRTKLLTRADL